MPDRLPNPALDPTIDERSLVRSLEHLYSILQLGRLVTGLPADKESRLTEQVNNLDTTPYRCPEGKVIEATPHTVNNKPLTLQFLDTDGQWQDIVPTSEQFMEVTSWGGGDGEGMRLFKAELLTLEDDKIWAYNKDGIRVLYDSATYFVEKEDFRVPDYPDV